MIMKEQQKVKRGIFSALFALVLVLSFSLIPAVPAAAADPGPTVTPGDLSTSAANIKAELKYRNLVNPDGLNGYEGILGIPIKDYPYYFPQAQNDFYRGAICDGTTGLYGHWNPTNHVKFTYDPTTSLLKSKVDASYSYCMEITSSLGSLNYLQLDVVNRATGTTVNFDNVTLNGYALGNFTGSGWSTWYVTGLDFTTGFTIEGDLVLAWPTPPASGQETNKLVLSVGALPTFTVDASVTGGHGSVSPASQTVNYNDSATINISPDTGYHIATITDNGNPATIANPYVISNVTANHTVVVTFAGPWSSKQDVLNGLIALRATVTDKQDGNKLDEAIKHLTKSLASSWWSDDAHLQVKEGEKVFNEEKDTVNKLRDLIKDKKSSISDEELKSFVDRIVEADRLLAVVAIADVAGGDPKDIAKANHELGKGSTEAALGKYDSAIEHYRNAWKFAQKSN
jgi:hypothetical protein